ncbi:MAG: hypothetical protein OXL41_13425 [Nitrospinae bacterium]|nr:hypothetical protein [Nitrospinota bacterium]
MGSMGNSASLWKKRLGGLFCAAALLAMTAGAASADDKPFTFVALGDMPYGKPAKVYAPFKTLIGQVNALNPAFTIHIGDTKSGSTPCSDEMLLEQLAFMNSFDAPLVYTPGDNEWTDCHRRKAGRFDPIERLSFLRKHYFSHGPRSLGKVPMKIERQSDLMKEYAKYPENSRFVKEGVHFVAAHVVGSNNNFEVRVRRAIKEFFARDAANVAWLKTGFDRAIAVKARALVLAIHADMFKPGFFRAKKEAFSGASGFKRFGDTLIKKAAAFKKPILLIYGDSHKYKTTRPFQKKAPNVVALQVFGAKQMHAVKVTVDTNKPAVFDIQPVKNKALTN